ncbi:MAG: hypothetical protein MK237_10280, partial [Gemmatimonadetes bacterium]|nr:hypothetical protein [Gemmatimonadota bacterium]
FEANTDKSVNLDHQTCDLTLLVVQELLSGFREGPSYPHWGHHRHSATRTSIVKILRCTATVGSKQAGQERAERKTNRLPSPMMIQRRSTSPPRTHTAAREISTLRYSRTS